MEGREPDIDPPSRSIAVVRDGEMVERTRIELDDRVGEADRSAILSLLEENVSVSKRAVKTGSVRVSTRTETREELAELPQERTIVDVTRVPVNRVVDEAPEVRTEGDTTIVSVLEERLVVVKQLVLVEELRIRRRTEHEVTRTPVSLRRQHVEIERLDADGRVVTPPRTDEAE